MGIFPTMNFAYMSWEAAATFATGFLAVGAALYVGIRQGRIQKAQTDLLGKQIEIQTALKNLEELKLKQALFEDRHEVYDQVRRYVAYIMSHAVVPGLRTRAKPSSDLAKEERALGEDFAEALDRSRFLFQPSVRETLLLIWNLAVTLNYHQSSQRVAGEPHARHVEKERDTLNLLRAYHDDLSRVFGTELLLSHQQQNYDASPTPTLADLQREAANGQIK